MIRWPQIILLLAALGAVVLLLLAPRIPGNVPPPTAETIEDRLQKALLMVEGEQPMKGIMALREIAEEDSTRAEAHWHLGRFALQTGQFDKAAARFKKVLAIEKDAVPEAWSFLAQAHLSMGDTSAAIEDLSIYKTLIEDTVITQEVDRFLIELKEKSENNAER